MRKLVPAGSLIVMCATALILRSTPDGGEVTAPPFPSERSLTRNPAESVALSALPLPAQAQIATVLGRDDAEYHAVRRAAALEMRNANHRLAVDFTRNGIEVRAGRATWRAELRGYGHGERLRAATPVVPRAHDNRVEYRRGDVTEWYVNGPLGVEQGFTLAQTVGDRRGEPLTIALSVSGTLSASVDASGTSMTLSAPNGVGVLRYGGLTAYDAAGRELRAWMELEADQLTLRVDDVDAQYPVVVDPFIQQSKLTASDGAPLDRLGAAVAISGDTVVVGAPFDDVGPYNSLGSAYVFLKTAGGWAGSLTESAKLTASDGQSDLFFGLSVAIEGDTIVVGALGDFIGSNLNQGSAYVFQKPAGGWSGTLNETAKLTASDGASNDLFGSSVSISGDTIVAGAPGPSGLSAHHGSAYVFVRPVEGWTGALSENAKLTASDGAPTDQFGFSVAISQHAVVIGAFHHDAVAIVDRGAAYLFVRPVIGWSGALTENAKLTASDGAADDRFGFSVAISGDTVVAGAPSAAFARGSAYVFVEPADGWSGDLTQNATLTASDGVASDSFGRSVAASGPNILVGATGDDIGSNANQGSVYVFVRPAGGWTGTLAETEKSIASDGAAGDNFGISAAVRGGTSVIGARQDDIGANAEQGSAYVFVGPEADLSLSKAASPEPVLAGSNLTYTITVTNHGPADASSVIVGDNLPGEVTFVSCSSTGGGSCAGSGNRRTVTFPSLASGVSETITLVVNVNAEATDGTILGNTASVFSKTGDPNPANDAATATTPVITQADLAVMKTASATVESGTNVTYTITVANNGPNSASAVTLTDSLAAGTTFVSHSPAGGWTCVDPPAGSMGSVTCSIASLVSGATATFTVVANVSCSVANGTLIANSATVTSSTPDPTIGNNAAAASVTASNPAPLLSAAVTTSMLSPTNMPALVSVGLSASTSDGVCAAPAVSSVEVFGDEDDETPIARGEVYSPDAADIGVGTLRLRAERVKNLDGRVYLIVVKTVDAAGGVAFATATVVVPQKPSPASLASVNAQAAAAKSYADAHGGGPPPGFFVIGDGPIIGPLQ